MRTSCWILHVFFLLALLAAGAARAELRITEILSAPVSDWNGDGGVDFKLDEWVEITNLGSAPESLDGVYLRDATGEAYHHGFSGALAPGEVLVVYGSDALQWQLENDAGTSGLSLNNSGDRLELWRDLASPRVLEALDVVEIPAHAAGADRAMALDPASRQWVIHDALSPYSGELSPPGTGCEPSPGVLNQCAGVVSSDRPSWGGLKSAY